MADVISSLVSGKQKHDAFRLAVEVFHLYMKTASTTVYQVNVKDLFYDITKEVVKIPKEVLTHFKHYLDVYFGLECSNLNFGECNCCTVSKK